MELSYRDLGRRVRAAREKKGITQERLAELADVGTAHISHVETARTKVSLPTLIKIANALDTSMDELLCGSLKTGGTICFMETALLLDDCSGEELRIIHDVVVSLKSGLRNRGKDEY